MELTCAHRCVRAHLTLAAGCAAHSDVTDECLQRPQAGILSCSSGALLPPYRCPPTTYRSANVLPEYATKWTGRRPTMSSCWDQRQKNPNQLEPDEAAANRTGTQEDADGEEAIYRNQKRWGLFVPGGPGVDGLNSVWLSSRRWTKRQYYSIQTQPWNWGFPILTVNYVIFPNSKIIIFILMVCHVTIYLNKPI